MFESSSTRQAGLLSWFDECLHDQACSKRWLDECSTFACFSGVDLGASVMIARNKNTWARVYFRLLEDSAIFWVFLCPEGGLCPGHHWRS